MGCKAICGSKPSDDNGSNHSKGVSAPVGSNAGATHAASVEEGGPGGGVQVTIVMPKTQKKAVFEYNDTEGNQTDLVMNIMNNLCFGKGKNVPAVLDGNFISIYNQKTDRHHYFCHRLMGQEIENATNPTQGKMWVCYINDKKQDWDDLVENNHKIPVRNTKITWKLENFESDLVFSKNHSTSISAAQIDVGLRGRDSETA